MEDHDSPYFVLCELADGWQEGELSPQEALGMLDMHDAFLDQWALALEPVGGVPGELGQRLHSTLMEGLELLRQGSQGLRSSLYSGDEEAAQAALGSAHQGHELIQEALRLASEGSKSENP